jgi:spore coat polysaccharide biosynthesis protein SpsF
VKKTAIIQARMGSTRLPCKIMKDIEGKPMLWHVVNRLCYSKLLDSIVISTTTMKIDDQVESLCKENKFLCFRGSENNVLDRYYKTASLYKADIIIRITSDCPLIDPAIVDLVINEYLYSNADYASNTIERTYPRGLDTEVFSYGVLKRCWNEAKEQYQREHVTPYVHENKQLFRLHNVKNKKNLSNLRWTVDEKADLRFVREIYKRFYKKKYIFLLKDILNILKKEPDLSLINKEVKQKHVKI